MWHHLFSLFLLLSPGFSFELNCERESFKSKHYQPSLMTVSRLTVNSYSVNLRCQGKTLDDISILHDHVDVKHDVDNSSLVDLVDGHFAKFVSMSCGDACFNPFISEHDLLTGRVCLAGQKSCRQTVVLVAEGYGDRNKDRETVGMHGGWRTLAAVVLMVNIIGAAIYCGCRLRRRNLENQKASKCKQNSNHNSSNIIVTKENGKENDDINYVSEFS